MTGNLTAVVVLALYCAVGAVILAVYGTAKLIRRATRARQLPPCNRDVPHDRVTLTEYEQDWWTLTRALLELEDEARKAGQSGLGDGGTDCTEGGGT